MSHRDRQAILRLLNEGNDKGALEMANNLFPTMSLEETADLVNEISLDPLDDVYRCGGSGFITYGADGLSGECCPGCGDCEEV